MPSSSLARSLFTVVVIASATFAQSSQQTCHGYNYQTNSAQPYPVSPGTEVGILYAVSPTAPFIVDQVELRFPTGAGSPTGPILINSPRGTIRIESADPQTGLPSGTVLASGTFNGGGNGNVVSIGSSWGGPTLTPVALAAGQLVWVIYSVAPFATTINIGVQPGGPDVVTSSLNPGTGWGALSVGQQFKMRLRSANCNPPGAGPTWLSVGAGCAASNGVVPSLSPSAPPALGTTVNLTVNGALVGGDAHLFFSVGAAVTPLTLPNGCPLWLESGSFLSLVQSGANPLLQAPITSTGTASFSVAVPFEIGLVGIGVGMQVAVDDPMMGFCVTGCELGLIGW